MRSLRFILLSTSVLSAAIWAQSNTFPTSGNAGIGTTDPGNNKLQIVRDLGTSDYTFVGQHQMHLRIRRASDFKAVELGVLDNGVAVLQANEAGVGYNSLALNPVTGNVGIGTISPVAKLDVAGSVAIANSAGINVDSFAGRVVAGGISDGSGWGLSTSIGGNSGVGRSWAIGSNGGDLYMGYQNSVSGASMQTFLQVSPNRNVYLVPASGNVGIGTIAPAAKLDVRGDLKSGRVTLRDDALEEFASDNDSAAVAINYLGYAGGYSRFRDFAVYNGKGGRVLHVDGSTGHVGIGVGDPSHKLTVNGTIRAKEVIVDTGWADYVFAEDYRLAPLSEVEAHIKTHKHLPDMPSATEVAEKGVSMGEMQARMMAKIEELTLHVIAQEKRTAELATKVQVLEAENRELRREVLK